VKVSVADSPLPAQPKPLPAWTPVALGQGGLKLAIPLRVTYAGLDTHLLSLLSSRPLHLNTPRGPGTISVDGLTIYPSGDRIAVGVHLQAKMPDSFFSRAGWLYWSARPQLTADGKGVHLADIGSSRLAGNPVAHMLMDVLDKEMQKGLAVAGKLDFTESLAKTAEQMKSGLEGQGSKLSFDLSNATIKLGPIVAGQDALFIEALFSAGAETPPAGNGGA
jgi:hypothetical protein